MKKVTIAMAVVCVLLAGLAYWRGGLDALDVAREIDVAFQLAGLGYFLWRQEEIRSSAAANDRRFGVSGFPSWHDS